MKEYEVYRIQERQYSSNIIEGGYTKDGKLIYEPVVASLLNKKEGDILCEKLYKYLSLKLKSKNLPNLAEHCIANFNNIVEVAKRLTSGNVSHHSNTIQGVAKRNSEFIKKYYI